jgi:hypothetical protein
MLHLFAVYLLCFLPLFSPVDLATAAGTPVIDYLVDDPPPLSAELPGKQNPLDHSDITHSFSLMLALDFATVFDCSYSNA